MSTEQSRNIGVIPSVDIKVPPFGTQSDTDTYRKPITWDSKVTDIDSATLIINAKQTFLSGAELDVLVNEQRVGSIHWNALEGGEKAMTMDIASAMTNGDNDFKLHYSLGFGTVNEQVCNVSGELKLTYRSTSTNPINSGPTQNKNFWKNLLDSAKKYALYIAAAIIAGLFLFAILKGVTSGGGAGMVFGKIGGFFKRILKF